MSALAKRALEGALSLPIWKSPSDVKMLGGGITNFNVTLKDQGRQYVVRVGQDIPLHQVMRFNESAVHKAAERIGIAPKIVHREAGYMVLEFIEGRTLDEAAVRSDLMLSRILPLIKSCHREGKKYLRGPILAFSVFHVIRDYAATLRDCNSPHVSKLNSLLATSQKLETVVGPIDLVMSHNDLLPANFIDDGQKLWLLDWEYGGFNSPLFDLAGLASNCELSALQELWMLENYFGEPASSQLMKRYHAMKSASLLRETMWSMVSERYSELEFDYADYTTKNIARFNAALSNFQQM